MFYCYKCKVDRVKDGDTFTGMCDVGFNMWFSGTFRLMNIDTPEISKKEPLAVEAKNYLENLISGKEIVIFTKKKDSFGRWLCEAEIDNEDISSLIKKNGFAKPGSKWNES